MNENTRNTERPADKRSRSGRHPSNIIFNLIALALLLTVIVFLHQILKKPRAIEQTEVKAVAALPAAEAPRPVADAKSSPVVTLPPVQVPEPEPPKIETPQERTAVVDLPVKRPEAKPVAMRTKKASPIAEQEISAPELDGEAARQKYIEDNKRLSSGDLKIERSSTKAAPASSYRTPSASSELHREASHRIEAKGSYDLDDETARRKYIEENKRMSKAGGTSMPAKPAPQLAPSGGDEYIPFENK